MFTEIFKNAEFNKNLLTDYGFVAESQGMSYKCGILNSFSLTVFVDKGGSVSTYLFDNDTNDEYTLYKTNAEGRFVGDVRQAISDLLTDIRDKCCKVNAFAQNQTARLCEYARLTYGDSPEYMWEKSDNCILRRKDTARWYAAIITVQMHKLGISARDKDKTVEIVNLHSDRVEELLQSPYIYRGWHMNKKHWVSVITDNSLSDNELFLLLDESYRLAKK